MHHESRDYIPSILDVDGRRPYWLSSSRAEAPDPAPQKQTGFPGLPTFYPRLELMANAQALALLGVGQASVPSQAFES